MEKLTHERSIWEQNKFVLPRVDIVKNRYNVENKLINKLYTKCSLQSNEMRRVGNISIWLKPSIPTKSIN